MRSPTADFPTSRSLHFMRWNAAHACTQPTERSSFILEVQNRCGFECRSAGELQSSCSLSNSSCTEELREIVHIVLRPGRPVTNIITIRIDDCCPRRGKSPLVIVC